MGQLRQRKLNQVPRGVPEKNFVTESTYPEVSQKILVIVIACMYPGVSQTILYKMQVYPGVFQGCPRGVPDMLKKTKFFILKKFVTQRRSRGVPEVSQKIFSVRDFTARGLPKGNSILSNDSTNTET